MIKLQCKDISDRLVLEFVRSVNNRDTKPRGVTWFYQYDSPPFDNSLQNVLPNIPAKLALAKVRMLLRRGLVEGCGCGCRGDFFLTDKGKLFLDENNETSINNPQN